MTDYCSIYYSRPMKKVLRIGAHTSSAGGAPNALYEGREIGATTIQFFTSNQKQWQGRKIGPEEVAKWKEALAETGIDEVMSHDSYLINLGSCKPDLLAKSRAAFCAELERCHLLGIPYLNFHPGTATDNTVEGCLDLIVESLLGCEKLIAQGNTRLLIETTAGQGSSVGHQFEHLGYLIDRVEKTIPIGVTIDTCHIFAAGYDIRTAEGWKRVLSQFDQQIGLRHLLAFHLNDSKGDLGSRVDRHAPLGYGKIGNECFRFLMTHPTTKWLPKYLETPDGPPLWKHEIAELKRYAQENS